MTTIPSPLDLVPSGWSILAGPSDQTVEILSQLPGATYTLPLEPIAVKEATLPINVITNPGSTPTAFRIPTQLFFILSALDRTDGSPTDISGAAETPPITLAKANSNVKAAYITAHARQIDNKYACKSCKKAKMHCYRANPDDSWQVP